MPYHQILLRKLVIITIGSLIGFTLVLMSFQFEKEPGYLAISGIFIIAVLGFTSARWVLAAIETVTGFTFFLSGRAVIFLYAMGTALAPLILPLGLIILLVQYMLARRRYLKESTASI